MPNPAGKLWTLLMLLQSRSNRTVSELAAELGVSARTVHRYIGMLEEMGIPLYSERGRYGGFSLVRGYRLPPMMFSNPEAVALALGLELVEQMWGSLYADPVRSAGAKLDLVLPQPQLDEVRLARRSLHSTGLHQIDADAARPMLETIHRAIRASLCLELAYLDPSGRTSERSVDPYALVHRWGWWYLVGWCHLRADVRTFRLDRITGLQIGGDAFTRPEDFDVSQYLSGQSSGPQVRLCFAAETAHLAILYRSWWDEIIPLSDGRVEVAFTSPDPESTAEGIMGLGPGISVVEPAGLRRRVAELARAIATNNS